MGKNSPFRRALHRLTKFELARPHGPDGLALRTRIPPLPLRHVQRLTPSLRESHQEWQANRRLAPFEQMRRRARRIAIGLAASGHGEADIERRLCRWQFHPALAFESAQWAMDQDLPPTATARAASCTDSGRPNQ